VELPVDLLPNGRSIGSMNYTIDFTAAGGDLSVDKCLPGPAMLPAQANQTCVATDDDVTVAIVNRNVVPIPAIGAGSVSRLLFTVEPGAAPGQIDVCPVPGSINFGGTDGNEVCAGPSACGGVIVDSCMLQGDCNCDGRVNSGDIVCLTTKFFDPTRQGECECEDCNLSGALNAADAPCITKCAFGACPETATVEVCQ
jgi:hypothetical protein